MLTLNTLMSSTEWERPSTTSMWSLLAVWCCVTWPSLSTAVDGVLWSAGADVLMVSEFDKPSLPQHAVGAAVPGAVVQSAPTSAQHRLVAGLSQQDNFNTPGTNQSVHAVSTSYPQQLVDPRIAIETRRTKMICAQILGGLVVSAMVPVLVYQGWWAFVSLSTLLLSLTVVQVAMKAALHDGLPYPYSLTALHMLLTVLTAFAAGPPRPGELRMALQTLPPSAAGGGAVLLHNVALTQASVSFVTMLGSCTPVVTYCMELAVGSRDATWKSAVPVLMGCLGGALCVRGEHSASLLAVVLVLLGCTSRGVKSIWQQRLICLEQLGPARLAAWAAVWTLLLTLPFAIIWEGASLFRAMPGASKHALCATLISCVAAVLLNLSQWTSMRYLGPVMQQMFGNLQLVFVLILAAVWLDEACSPEQVLGTVILVIGVLVAKAAPEKVHNARKSRLSQVPQPGYQATETPRRTKSETA